MLALLVAGSLIANESLTLTVIIHITADMGVPTYGDVWCLPEGNASNYQEYHGADDYIFDDVYISYP
ncbi:MAG: hypothetical protein KAW87_01620, partial [Candidatus Cloacimonetes bacterium]|nr:hypothetical protein [Candidatus Cloacimonadota bacterium]